MRALPQSVEIYLAQARARIQADKDRKSAGAVMAEANAAALKADYARFGAEPVETAGMIISASLLTSLGVDLRKNTMMSEAAE